MDSTIILLALVIPALVIWRYHAVGVLISIPLAWGLLALVLLVPHPDTWQEREFKEDWPALSFYLSMVWCLLIAEFIHMWSLAQGP